MSASERSEITIADAGVVSWEEHPRIRNVFMKTLLTAGDNALANVNLVKVPVGGEVPLHLHADEVETVYVLAGRSTLVLGEAEVAFDRGQAVAIPKGLEHALINVGDEAVELITFFTPPLG